MIFTRQIKKLAFCLSFFLLWSPTLLAVSHLVPSFVHSLPVQETHVPLSEREFMEVHSCAYEDFLTQRYQISEIEKATSIFYNFLEELKSCGNYMVESPEACFLSLYSFDDYRLPSCGDWECEQSSKKIIEGDPCYPVRLQQREGIESGVIGGGSSGGVDN